MSQWLDELGALLGVGSAAKRLPGVEPVAFTEAPEEIARRLAATQPGLATALLEEAQAHNDVAGERAESAERRATTLQGAVAIATSLMLAGSALVLDSSKLHGTGWKIALGAALFASTAFLIMAGYRAVAATSRLYGWASPDPNDIYEHAAMTEEGLKVARAADLIKSYGRNQAIANKKIDAMRRAAVWFTRALLALLVLTFTLGLYVAVGRTSGTDGTKTPSSITGPTGPVGPMGAPGPRGPRGHRGSPADDG
jgi:hypothetical protein